MVKMSPQRFGPVAGLVTLLSLATMAAAQDMTYCASFNTADGDATVNNFQSSGLCFDTCNGKSAFAVLQDKNCWCTDYSPASSVRVSADDCDQPCPGYPANKCGGNGVWGYIQLGKQPAGTKGGSSPSPTAKPKPQDPVTETVQNTVTISPPATHDQNSSPTTKPVPVSGSPDTSTTKVPHDTPQPSTMVSTITQDGGTRLQTVTVFPSMPTTTSDSEKADAEEQSSGGLSAGAAAGVAVGVIGFFLILGGIAAFLWFRRRQNRQQAIMEHQNSVRGSSSGMMGTPRTEMASVWDGDSMGRRNSRFMPHDPRMDPFAPNIYGRFDNKSHESVNTLRDDQDYSRRVLRTTNPDPDNA